MADEQIVNEQPQPTDTAPDKGGQAAAKTFTQEDVDRLIGERLERERQKLEKERAKITEKFSDYDDLKAAAAEWQKAQDAKKTEEQKAAERMAKMEQQLAELQSQNARLAQEREQALVRAAITTKATTLHFRDPSDAWRMIDTGVLKLADDGSVENLDEQLKALSEAKPYLLSAQEEPTQPKLSPTNPGRGPAQGETDAERRARLYGYGGTPIGGASGGGVLMPTQLGTE